MEISCLGGVAGCYARNDYFANFFDLSKSRCSTIINRLKKKGYIICAEIIDYLNENSSNDDNSIWNKDINSFDDDNNNSSREGGQACGKQYKTFRNDRENKKNTEVKQPSKSLKGCWFNFRKQ